MKEAKFGLYDNERCDGTPVASGVTDDKGMLIFSPTGQENGTGHTKMDWADSSTETRYYLQEIRAPEGYTQAMPVAFACSTAACNTASGFS